MVLNTKSCRVIMTQYTHIDSESALVELPRFLLPSPILVEQGEINKACSQVRML